MHQQQPQYGYQHQPQRSAIPKVIGILMIIFASLGLLGGLIGLAGNSSSQELFKEIPEFKTYRTLELLTGVIGLAIGILHLFAGIRAVSYKANAIGLAKFYAIAAMVVQITSAILIYAWMKPMMDKALEGIGGGAMGNLVGGFMVIGTLIGLAWPTIVLILMTRPAAKDACTNL